MDPVEASRWLVSGASVLFAWRLQAVHRTQRMTGCGWLAAAFTMLAAATILEPVRGWPTDDVLGRLSLAVAVLYPVLLVRFVDAVAGTARAVRAAVPVGAVGVAALVLPGIALGDGSVQGPFTAADSIGFALFAGVWLAAHGAASSHLWRGARDLRPSLPRRRMHLAAAAFLVLGGVLLLARSSDPGVAIAVRALAVLAIAGLWLAMLPPVRLLSLHAPPRRVHAFELSMVRDEDPEVLFTELTRLVGAMTGATQVWLLHDGEVVRSCGLDAEEAASLSGYLPASDGCTQRVAIDRQAWLIAVPFGASRLVMRTGVFTPLIASRTVEVIERLAGLAAVAVDRAGTKMIERHARQRVEELAGLKDDFLSTVSHELRTPVTVIRGVVELLRRDPQHLHELRPELLDRLGDNVKDLTAVVESFERLASLRTGSGLRVLTRFELPTATDAARRLVERRVRNRSFISDVADVTLHQDQGAVVRILAELLTNASKHTEHARPIEICARHEDPDVVIEVTDHGEGLTPDEQARAFEPFYRTGDVLNRSTRGAGVGLAIVQGLTRQLGGTCELRSRTSQGTTAVVRVPRVHPQATTFGLRPATSDTSDNEQRTAYEAATT